MTPLALAAADWAQIAVAVAAFIGLGAVALQLRALTKATTMSAYQSFASLMVDVDKTMIENPRLRACMYDNAPVPEDPELRQQAEATAEMFVDVADLVFQLRGVMPPGTADSWIEHFRGLATSSQVLRGFVGEYRASYPADMMDHIFPGIDTTVSTEQELSSPPTDHAAPA